ncbi:MAG: radical SAM protein [Magnetococcales bacterium]|nr:radical SAM protein [Magnetococcales bacterium]
MCFIEKSIKSSKIRSLPYFIKIEPTPKCHLYCPGCWHSRKEFKKKFVNSRNITVEEVGRIIEPVSSTLVAVSLSQMGEPLLHRDLVDMIEKIHSFNVAVTFPTNLSVPMKDDWIDRFVLSGVDAVLVGLDGLSRETYEQYRKGGNFDLVVNNVRRIAAAKKRLGRSRPRLVWKFIVFDHNAHEVHEVPQKYREMGFDDYEIVLDNHLMDEFVALERSPDMGGSGKRSCFWPYGLMVVEYDGQVQPCCTSGFRLGNAIETDTREIWHGPSYETIRRGFSSSTPVEEVHPVCRLCLGLASKDTLNIGSMIERR